MAEDIFFKKIKDYLLAKNLIDESKLDELAGKVNQDNSLEALLIESKVFSPDDFARIKGEIFNLPVADLGEMEIAPETLNLLSEKIAKNYQMVVFKREGSSIYVGLANPADFQAHEAIEFLAKQHNWESKYFVISLYHFREAMQKYGSFRKEIGSALEVAKERFAEQAEVKVSEKDLETVIRSAPVAKIVSVIVKHALDGGASDIHIEPGYNESRVRYRVDGILHGSLVLPKYLHSAVISRIKVLANLKLDETRVPQDGRIRMQFDNQAIDLRVSVLPVLDEEKVVMRVLDTSLGVPTLVELGFEPRHIEIIERNIKKAFGLFLLTGPTGSGKTTTLYSVLNMLNSEGQNITTLEDPIEYYMNGINQSQVRPEIGFSFADGLRAILRQDPNIIMVGEIRDNETVELVIHAGLTGHLVFSTLHTNNAWGAIPRLIDMKAEPFLLASTLNLVMAQRLVRKICPECKTETKLPPRLAEKIQQEIKNIPADLLKDLKDFKFYHGKGCDKCGNTGYAGRTVLAEIMEFSSGLRELVSSEDFSPEKVQLELTKQNYTTLVQDGVIKALKGNTTIEEVMRVAAE